ncbi:MAG: hypothetical protein ACREBC_22845, partial [Pyrinomonadaceae bacterium]
YRFVAPVRRSGSEHTDRGSKLVASETTQVDAARPTSGAEYIFSQIKTHKYSFAGLLGIAALLIAGVGFGLYKLAFQKKTGISLASTQITRLTSSGNVVGAAISADGKWLVYVESDGELRSLWLKQVAVPWNNRQIMAPAAVGYTGVAISPDGNYVYYTMFDRDSVTGTLYQVPVLGGTPRKLFTGIYGSVALSPDGKQIAYYHWMDDEDRLMVANPDGTGQRQLLARRGNDFLVFTGGPSWSPDSKTILTTIGTFTPEQSMTVAVVSPENGAINLFSQQKFKRIDYIAWLSDGQGVLVSATDEFASNGPGGSNKIWQISYPSGNAQRITNDLNSYQTISLTADSNSLATVQTETLSGIIGVNVGIIHLMKRDPNSAAAEFKRIVEFDPNWWGGHFYLGAAYLQLGRNEDALLELQKSVEMTNRSGRSIAFLGYAYGVMGRRSEAQPIIKELEDKYARRKATGQSVAAVHMGLGDKEQAFAWLEKDLQARSGDLVRIRWYPPFDSLRSELRFQDLLKRMGVPE